MKDISYGGGVVRFRIPANWIEEADDEGGAEFYEDVEDSGTLRLSVITMTNDEPLTPEDLAATITNLPDVTVTEVTALPNGNVFAPYIERDDEDGEAITIYCWLLGGIHAALDARIASFSYTVLTSQETDPKIQSEITLLEREIRAAVFA